MYMYTLKINSFMPHYIVLSDFEDTTKSTKSSVTGYENEMLEGIA